MTTGKKRAWARRWVALTAVLAIVAIAGTVAVHRQHARARLAAQLLSVYPQEVMRHPELVRFAIQQARPLYQQRCAACHGRTLHGNPAIGAADLVDGGWLWGNGTVFQIERIILYGIRSGDPQALNETDMPAYGVMGRLNDGQVRELVQYLLKLNNRPYEVEAADAGEMLFHDTHVGCYDCHGGDERGTPDYGAPDLTNGHWNNGADPQSIYDSIFYGRHRVMPAWRGVLSLEQIRALAVYVHSVSQSAAPDRQPSGVHADNAAAASSDMPSALSAQASGGNGVAR